MSAMRAAVIFALCSSPLWAEGVSPVIGAKRAPHHAAPLPFDGEGDYGYAGAATEQPDDPVQAPQVIPPDEDLLAYEAEEAQIEAEAALSVENAGATAVYVD